jgi:lysophospholipase L1-like esterase
MKKFLLIPVLALTCTLGLQATEGSFPFKNGDVWCALGDSITHGGSYHHDVELFYVTRYPENSLKVINCGVGGDTARGALRRLGWDCLDHKPSVVSVMLGMNDVNRNLYDATNAPSPELERLKADADASYRTNMASLTSLITNTGARLILITPSIFDDTGDLKATNKPGCAAALTRYANDVKTLAAQRGAEVVDFNGSMTAINTSIQKTNAAGTIVGADRVHPGPVGHFVMAYEFLKAQKPLARVSLIGVDASTGKPAGCERCDVSDIKAKPDEVSFTCLEKSLPYPVPDEKKPALGLVLLMDELNGEILKVTGLKAGSYQLVIDDIPIRTYTAEKLASGVNISAEQTPQSNQALLVAEILKKKWDAALKLRNIAAFEYAVWPHATHSGSAGEGDLMKGKIQEYLAKNPPEKMVAKSRVYDEIKPQENELKKSLLDATAEAYATAKPTPHRFVIKKIETASP